ncbi:MDR family MFS transporter [Thermoflavimicrobium daqui]|nr:MFS transporter [Thermoflavimicrobium daqui]
MRLKEYPRNVWILAIGTFIYLTGLSFLWPLVTIYVVKVLGSSEAVAGGILFVYQGMGVLGSLLGGFLHDKMGGKKTVVIGSICAAGMSLAFLLRSELLFFALILGLYGFFVNIVFPSLHAMATEIWPEGGQKAFNLLYIFRNVGVAVGSALGGFLAQFSFTYVFIGIALVFVIFLFLIVLLVPNVRQAISPKEQHYQKIRKDQLIPIIVLCIGLSICWIVYVQWQTNISSYMANLGFSLSEYSFLWTINGLVILLFQPLLAWVIGKWQVALRAQLLLGVMLFIGSTLLISQVQFYVGFLLGMVILTWGEILVWTGVPAIAAQLAPAGKLGRFQGFVESAGTFGRMLGPLIGGILYEKFHSQIMLIIMSSFLVIPLVCFYVYQKFQIPKTSELSSK